MNLNLPDGITDNDIVNRLYLHSIKKRLPDGEVVLIKEKVETNDGKVYPNIRVIRNPVRTFYITKPEYRDHTYKKEYEHISRLDEYRCYNSELFYKAKKALGLERTFVKHLKSLCNNPYLYKADIDIEPLIKMNYADRYPNGDRLPISVGFLDIETDPSNDDEICIISYSHENIIYTAFLNNRMFQEENGKMNPFGLKTVVETSKKFYEQEIEENDFTFHYFIGETEIDILLWIFSKIHENQTDFVGIWNIDFDISIILKCCQKNKFDPMYLFVPNYIPPEYRYFNYRRDPSDVAHFTLKWHWVYNSSGTQFFDAMSLYSTLRKTVGFEPSYKLESILTKYLKRGKVLNLTLSEHIRYVNQRFLDYIIYNQFDVMGLYLLELKNKDITQLVMASKVVPVSQFNHMSRRITYEHFYYLSKKGIIISSTGKNIITEEDLIQSYYKKKLGIELSRIEAIPRYGGAVLRPERCRGTGVDPFTGRFEDTIFNDNLFTLSVSDMDLSSAYPTNMISYNISRTTANTTLFEIEEKPTIDVYDLFNNLVASKENAYYLANKFFGLPSYLDLE